MKNKAFKIILALLFMFSITAFAVTFNQKVYAEEIVDSLNDEETPGDETPSEEATTTEEQEEVASLTEEEKGKLDAIAEWVSKLDKEELFTYIETAKNWLVAGGIITVLGFLSAIIGLVVALLKLSRERVIRSQMSEENKNKTNERIDKFEKMVVEGNNQLKVLILDLVNNMSDEEKKAIESNINDVKAKLEQALSESKKTE